MTDVESQSIVREVWIAATPEDVFPYFTDADKLSVWKAAWAESDARLGGGFRADITGRGDIAYGAYLEIEPLAQPADDQHTRRVVFTWQWQNAELADLYRASVVEVTLAPDGGGTLLRLALYDLYSGERCEVRGSVEAAYQCAARRHPSVVRRCSRRRRTAPGFGSRRSPGGSRGG